MKTKILPVMLVTLLLLGTVLPSAYANHGKGHGRGSWGGGDQGLEGKFFHKAHVLLKLQDEIGLTEDQAKAIRDLKMEMKKNHIRQKAEIKILKMDIHSALKADAVDAKQVELLIEKKYEAKTAMAKSFLDAYLKLKGTLNDKQREALKTVKKQWKEKYKSKG